MRWTISCSNIVEEEILITDILHCEMLGGGRGILNAWITGFYRDISEDGDIKRGVGKLIVS